jgi:hypothetical protein
MNILGDAYYLQYMAFAANVLDSGKLPLVMRNSVLLFNVSNPRNYESAPFGEDVSSLKAWIEAGIDGDYVTGSVVFLDDYPNTSTFEMWTLRIKFDFDSDEVESYEYATTGGEIDGQSFPTFYKWELGDPSALMLKPDTELFETRKTQIEERFDTLRKSNITVVDVDMADQAIAAFDIKE